MKLTIKFNTIDYIDVITKIVPLLQQDVAVPPESLERMLDIVANFPKQTIHDIFDEMSLELKNGILSIFASKRHDKLLEILTDALRKHNLSMVLTDCSVEQDLTLNLYIRSVDHASITQLFLPPVWQKPIYTGKIPRFLHPFIHHASTRQLTQPLPRSVTERDAFVASLIEENQSKLIGLVENAAAKQGIHLKIASIVLDVHTREDL